jgi:hypothetical protein
VTVAAGHTKRHGLGDKDGIRGGLLAMYVVDAELLPCTVAPGIWASCTPALVSRDSPVVLWSDRDRAYKTETALHACTCTSTQTEIGNRRLRKEKSKSALLCDGLRD